MTLVGSTDAHVKLKMYDTTFGASVETLAEQRMVVESLLKRGSMDYNGTILTWHPEFQWFCTESSNGFQCYFIDMDSMDFNGTAPVSIGLPGLSQHRENREFGSPFFQTGKTQGICQK